MSAPVRVVSTSDRYDFEWEQGNFAAYTALPVEFVTADTESQDELIALARGAQGLLVGARETIDSALLTQLPDLKVVGRLSVGLDTINLDDATAHSVVITHYPMYCTHEVADHAIALIYALNRKIVEFDRDLRAGRWVQNRFQMSNLIDGRILALRNKTLGIVGLGRIGQQVAKRMAASVGKIIAADPYLEPAVAASLGVELVSLETLLQKADIIDLHCPLTAETRHLISAEELAQMKPTAHLVNTARGPIIDLAALDTALEAGQLAGAGLDVFEEEPLPLASPLHRHHNVILTPHAAYYSEESADTIRIETMTAVMDVLEGREPKVVANPAVLAKLNLQPRS